MLTLSRWMSKGLFTLSAIAVAIAAGCGNGPLVVGGVGGGSGGAGSGGAGGDGGSGNGPPVLGLSYGAPAAPAKEPESQAFAIEGYASALGANAELVGAGTTTSVYRVEGAGPTLLSITGDEPDLPFETGRVRAIAPFEDGLLVAADQALFFTKGGALQLSLGSAALHPLGIRAMSARVADDDGDGTSETHLALVSESGAYELDAGALVRWTVEGESAAPTALLAQRGRVTVAFGHAVYEIDKATKKAYPLLFDIGAVREIACGSQRCDEGSLLYFATDQGLVERAPDGAFTRYPLAEQGAKAVPVETFALDAERQRLYALAGGQVLRLRSGELPVAVASSAEGNHARRIAVDKFGDVWLGEGLALRRLALGTPLSFETDVRPIVHEYCAGCHATGTQGAPKLDFETFSTFVELIDPVLKRVKEGSMPPSTYDKKLPADKIQILEDWAVTKAP